MDLQLLTLLAKVKGLGRRYANADVDIVRLCAERAYAAEVLREFCRRAEPELIAASVETMARLGLVDDVERRIRSQE